MSPLRRQMIQAMRVRGYSVRTHQSYLGAVRELARFSRRCPAEVSDDELKRFFVYLATERGLSGASCRLYLNAIRFLYLKVLEREAFDVELVLPKRAQRIPELLTRSDVSRIIGACGNFKHRTMLLVCYGCGLRVSELVRLKVRDIDGERRLLRVCQGKGAKDRQVVMGAGLHSSLREYWRAYRPSPWLFAHALHPRRALSVSTAQRVFTGAKRRAGVDKIGGIHSLRHAYATHQLDNGVAVHQLQKLLGHADLHSTTRYLHWVPQCVAGTASASDLVGALELGGE